MAELACSATGLNAPGLVTSADVSETADWRRMAGRTPALPPVDAARPGTTAAGGWDAVGCETRLDERRERGCPDIGDACESDMVDW